MIYAAIETDLARELPELRPSLELYWKLEGKPGADAGPYILFEDLFRPYLAELLMAPQEEARDRLLMRAFSWVEEMLGGPEEIRDLACIALFESQTAGWHDAAQQFLGPRAKAEFQRFGREWLVKDEHAITLNRTDLYQVSGLVLALLRRTANESSEQLLT